MKFSENKFKSIPIIGIIRGTPFEKIPTLISLFVETGFTTIEITMNTDRASKVIEETIKSYATKLNVGAGTVRSMSELHEAIRAGSQFIVTPILNFDIIKECKNQQIPIFPGAYTPTEVYNAWEAGATAVKIFPTITGGINHIKAIKAPLDMVPLIPTGGVNTENLADFLNLGVYGVGAGSQLFPKGLIEKNDWEGLRNKLNDFKNVYDSWRHRVNSQ